MAHYAILDTSNVVTNVIVGREEKDQTAGVTNWEAYYAHVLGVPVEQVKRTSYNTINGEHREGGIPFRKNYAGPGYTYDTDLDAFIPPQPFPSWTLNESTLEWEPPTPQPDPRFHDDDVDVALWDEETLTWVWPPPA